MGAETKVRGKCVCVSVDASERMKTRSVDALERRVRHCLLLPPEPELLPVQHQDHHLCTYMVVCDISVSIDQKSYFLASTHTHTRAERKR